MILLLTASERALERLNLEAATIAEKWRLIFMRRSLKTGILQRWAQAIHLVRVLDISSGPALRARRRFSLRR